MYLRFAHRGRGTFLCLRRFAQRKVPKRKRTPDYATPPEPERLLGPALSHAATMPRGKAAHIPVRRPAGFSQKAFGLGRSIRGGTSTASTPIWAVSVCYAGTAGPSDDVATLWLRRRLQPAVVTGFLRFISWLQLPTSLSRAGREHNSKSRVDAAHVSASIQHRQRGIAACYRIRVGFAHPTLALTNEIVDSLRCFTSTYCHLFSDS